MTLSAAEVHELKRAPVVEGILPIIHSRWSARAFSDREVSSTALAQVFEAARWAPSGGNGQPWHYIVGVRNLTTHQQIASTLGGLNQAWAPHAPVLILGVARAVKDGKTNPYALYDLGAATALLALQAAVLGLNAHQMAGYDHDAARRVLGIPEEYALGTVIALGYQDHPETLQHDQLIAREIAPRERKPLKDFVYSSWGVPAELG